jgi:hypothetical protein
VGIERVAPGEWQGDRVDREVATGEVSLYSLRQWGEVHRVTPLERNAPRAVPLGEREGRAVGLPRVGAGRLLRLPAGNVQVDELATEELVPDSAPDDPRFLPLQNLSSELTHRQRF